jgi:hypothetical protein
MIPPYIRENMDFSSTIPRFEVIDFNDLGHLHVAYQSDIKSLCQDYIDNL